MSGWTVVVCPAPGQSSRRYRLGPLALGLMVFAAVVGLVCAGFIGWSLGEYQAESPRMSAAAK